MKIIRQTSSNLDKTASQITNQIKSNKARKQKPANVDKKAFRIRLHPGYGFFERPESLDTQTPRPNTSKQARNRPPIHLQPPSNQRQRNSDNSPPTHARLRRRLTLASFSARHRDNLRKLQRYLEQNRVDGQKLPKAVIDEFEIKRSGVDRSVDYLYANNVESRIAFAKIVLKHMQSIPLPAFLVTLMPVHFALDEEASKSFDLSKLPSWVRAVLPGLDFLGMVDVGFFPDPRGAIFTWHVHLCVWGKSYPIINDLLRSIRKNYTAYVPGTLSASCRTITNYSDLESRVLYLMKGPQKRYRVLESQKRTVADPSLGEIVAKRYVRKDDLRPGELARMAGIFEGRLLDHFLFGQGEGTAMKRAVCYEALASFRAYEARHANRPKSGNR